MPSLADSSSKTRMNSSPMILRFFSGSSTPASLVRKRSLASIMMRFILKVSLKIFSIDSGSFLRMRPWSTKTQVSWSPTARCTSAAQTELSTPPERAQRTFLPPTVFLISSTALSMKASTVQSCLKPQDLMKARTSSFVLRLPFSRTGTPKGLRTERSYSLSSSPIATMALGFNPGSIFSMGKTSQ